MTPEEYLRARGWRPETNYKPDGGEVVRWFDRADGHCSHASTEIATSIQVRRDHDCAEFAASHQASDTLDRCDAANAAMAQAKADGLDADAVRVVGERVMAGVGS